MMNHQFYAALSPIFILALFTFESAASAGIRRESIDEHTWERFNEFLRWEKFQKTRMSKIPSCDEPALVGRYVVNHSNWSSAATISTDKHILKFPFANVVAVSDGLIGEGNGIPYMLLTPLDFTGKDIDVDARATLLMTLAEGSYCTDQKMEPIDPRCVRVILSGTINKIPRNATDYNTAKAAIYGRHPDLKNLPKDHEFYLAKLNIQTIIVLCTFGGAKFVPVDEYFNLPIPENFNNLADKKMYDVLQI